MNRPLPWIRVALWLAFAGWAAAIVFLSSLPGPEIAAMMPFALWDKFLHFSAFALGGALLAAALHASFRWPWRRLALCAAAVLALFGASDEWHQLYTPNRSGADVYDWLADALGALTGAAGFLTAQLLRRGRADAA